MATAGGTVGERVGLPRARVKSAARGKACQVDRGLRGRSRRRSFRLLPSHEGVEVLVVGARLFGNQVP
jgi:hypothetical protein